MARKNLVHGRTEAHNAAAQVKLRDLERHDSIISSGGRRRARGNSNLRISHGPYVAFNNRKASPAVPAFGITDIRAAKTLGVDVQAPGEQTLLGMQAIFRLVEHHRLRSVDHLVGNLLAAMRRQAVHEQCVRLGLRHQAGIDLVALEHVVAVLAVAVAD